MYIDIHTHHQSPDRPDVIAVRSIPMQEAHQYAPSEGFFSIGLHPWESETVDLDHQLFDELIARPEIIAVGECGLDRLRGADIKKQTILFVQQAIMAETRHKPLIIHCVRAWQEIMSLKTELNPKVPWIIHSYRGKSHVAAKLVDLGFYLSFGESLLSFNPVLSDILRNTPDERFFLESDDGRRSIEDIYDAARQIKKLSLESIRTCLISNFEKVFDPYGTSRMASAD